MVHAHVFMVNGVKNVCTENQHNEPIIVVIIYALTEKYVNLNIILFFVLI